MISQSTPKRLFAFRSSAPHPLPGRTCLSSRPNPPRLSPPLPAPPRGPAAAAADETCSSYARELREWNTRRVGEDHPPLPQLFVQPSQRISGPGTALGTLGEAARAERSECTQDEGGRAARTSTLRGENISLRSILS